MQDIKPCPFCRSEDVATSNTVEEGTEGYGYVECHNCGAQGPFVLGELDAIIKWNERA